MLIKFVKLTLAISLTTCSTTPDPMAGIQALLDAADLAASTLALPCSPAVVTLGCALWQRVIITRRVASLFAHISKMDGML